MTKLSDTQAILLSSASQREGGSIYPLSASLNLTGGISKAVDTLVKHGLAEELETGDAAAVRRTDGDRRYGLFITPTGLAAIGVARPSADGVADSTADQPSAAAVRVSKTAGILKLLGRPAGATLAELIEATGWLPHTTRAALTGLRKKGHVLERCKRDHATCYRLVSGS